MKTVEDNPYAAPDAAELHAMPRVQLKPPGLASFLLAALYAALLTVPLIAVHQLTRSILGLEIIASLWYLQVYSITGMLIGALGDGLTAMMCWKTVANRPRSLPLFAAALGARILAALSEGSVLFNVKNSIPDLEYFAALSLHYGVPSVVLTAVFLRLAYRRVPFWVYPTIYIAAVVAGPIFDRIIWEAVAYKFRIVGTAGIGIATSASQGSFLCILAAILWFGVKTSQSAITPPAERPESLRRSS